MADLEAVSWSHIHNASRDELLHVLRNIWALDKNWEKYFVEQIFEDRNFWRTHTVQQQASYRHRPPTRAAFPPQPAANAIPQQCPVSLEDGGQDRAVEQNQIIPCNGLPLPAPSPANAELEPAQTSPPSQPQTQAPPPAKHITILSSQQHSSPFRQGKLAIPDPIDVGLLTSHQPVPTDKPVIYPVQFIGQQKRKALEEVDTNAPVQTKKPKTGGNAEPDVCANCGECLPADWPLTGGDEDCEDCVYHPGDLNYHGSDNDSYDDYDEAKHRSVQSIETQIGCPEEYRWNCCGEKGNRPGCEKGPHENGEKTTYAELRATGLSVVTEHECEQPLDRRCSLCKTEHTGALLKTCKYHPGYLEVDWESDFWADHDENCHGRIDKKSMRVDFPGGYIWDCCDDAGDASRGCCLGTHKEAEESYHARLRAKGFEY